MLDYIEFLKMPSNAAIALVGLFLAIQVIGELLEFKGKAVPEFVKIRKYFARKKKEREVLQKMPEMLENVQKLLNDVRKHYDEDNIMMRDKWIDNVNRKLEENDTCIKELNKKMDKNNHDTLSLLVDSKRNEIINFASRCADDNNFITREQFNRIFKVHKEYESILEENNMTNGEVDIAFRIITESYENHTKTHTFIEDIRGYENRK